MFLILHALIFYQTGAQISGAAWSRYFCLYDFTSRIVDCSVCSGSTIATDRDFKREHRCAPPPPPAFGRTRWTFASSRFVSSEAAAARMRKLEPLEFAIGRPERSIFESLFAQSANPRICRSRGGSREIPGRDARSRGQRNCTETPRSFRLTIASSHTISVHSSNNHDR